MWYWGRDCPGRFGRLRFRRLGGRLSPVAIRRSEDVEAALAEGTTVLDYAPDTEVAEDFQTLAEWIAGLG